MQKSQGLDLQILLDKWLKQLCKLRELLSPPCYLPALLLSAEKQRRCLVLQLTDPSFGTRSLLS